MSGWRSLAYAAARPLLFRFDSERIHRLTLDGLRLAGESPAGRWLLRLAAGATADAAPATQPLGLPFRNRVGLAAGFDKDGVALRGWSALGLGFVEIGTVTPSPQAGNRRPRLFRLVEDGALVNRMGFNNRGAAELARQLMRARRHLPPGFVVGVNIARGRRTPNREAVADYLAVHRLVAPVADYLVVNVSSPNSPGLRELQEPRALGALLGALRQAGERLGADRPLLVKLAPDLAAADFERIVGGLAGSADGLVLSNTARRRPPLRSPLAAEEGGLSGAPLRPATLKAVARARALVGTETAIVASGGIGSAADVAAAYRAGADLVQLWTGLVYRGPGLIGEAIAVPHRAGGADW